VERTQDRNSVKLFFVVTFVLAATAAAGCERGGPEGKPETFAARELTQPGTLRICADVSRPPMAHRGRDGVLRGFEVDLLRKIAGLYDLEPVWVETAHSALVDSLAAGKCDLIASALTVRYDDQRRISEFPYLFAPIGVLVRDEEPPPVALGLCGRAVGTLARTPEEDLARRYSDECVRSGRPPAGLVVAADTDEALEKLGSGDVDVLLDGRPTTDWFARRETDRFDDGGALPSADRLVYAIGYGRGKKTLFSGLQGALFTLNRDGTLAELIARWRLEDAGVRLLRLA
jgi:polar amino acid transport system substrate-binding protein